MSNANSWRDFFMRGWKQSAAAAASLIVTAGAHGVVIYDSTQNLAAPGDDRGYKYVGEYGAGNAVAVGPHEFLTAQHLGVSIGAVVSFNSAVYVVSDWADIPGTTMRVLKTSNITPIPGSLIAPLYTNTGDHNGITASIVGRGGPKGVTNNGTFDLTGHGWYWTSPISTHSWGMNTLTSDAFGYIHYNFDPLSGVNEAMMTPGDSGGGVFVNDGGAWKLIGINEGVDALYANQTDSPSSFLQAAIYDAKFYSGITQTGLWEPDINGDLQLTTLDSMGGYASNVPTNAAAIQAAINAFEGVPEPGTLCVMTIGAMTLLRRRNR
jgi:hypothetical protein